MIYKKDTVYALSTLLGKSGVAIIRVSGSAYFEIAKKYDFADKLIPNKLFRQNLISFKDGSLIDECMIVYFKSPHSFTGEDILEFHTHGSVAVIKKLLSELSTFKNVRLADQGEFSKRAFLNGKLDLSQAEGLAALIEAETEMQRQVASRQMAGEQSSLYENWRHMLIKILAKLEALIDFPTEDIPADVLNNAANEIANISKSICKHLKQKNSAEIIKRGIRVCIIGEPNAGKSTLINAIARRDVSITSQIAGTTRDVIEVRVDIAGFPFIFYDTAGIRESEDAIEKEGVKRAYNALEDADLCLLVSDSVTCIPEKLLNHIRILNKDYKIVRNKIDLATDLIKDSDGIINVSLLENDEAALELIISYLEEYASKTFTPSLEPLIASERHRVLLIESVTYLDAFNIEYPIDISSEYVRMAANSLGQIMGKIDVEEILDTIFSSFCIGK
ncbi:MAG: tRNA uridine-5-carboxymethylaminomethyl(34) synthesis GTPase MnmE [Candidatus Jidaibacter sp.]|jgi:tRNA modification GTPase|nr:tRNA uridine-5-carboxymethylaminomethyl(34) synthesis GTPase MnmE [Candidatus Jidaibacter sp.]